MRQQNFATLFWNTSLPHQRRRGGRRSLSIDREDRQFIRMIRGQSFHFGPSSVRGDDPPRLSVLSIINRLMAVGHQSMCSTRCPRLTWDHRRRRRVCGRTHIGWDRRHWRHCVFSDESRFTLFHSDGRARVRHRQWDKLIGVCIQPMDGSRGPSVMVWGTIHHGGMSELVVLRSWTGQLGVQTWTLLSMFGTKLGSASETWMTPFHGASIPACCSLGVGCNSPKKGEDPGGKHATTCAGSFRRQRGSHKVLMVWWHGCKHFNRLIKQIWPCAFGFLSWHHRLNALFLHCGLALTLLLVILPVAEPARVWGPTFLSIVETKHIKLLTTKFYLPYQNFEK